MKPAGLEVANVQDDASGLQLAPPSHQRLQSAAAEHEHGKEVIGDIPPEEKSSEESKPVTLRGGDDRKPFECRARTILYGHIMGVILTWRSTPRRIIRIPSVWRKYRGINATSDSDFTPEGRAMEPDESVDVWERWEDTGDDGRRLGPRHEKPFCLTQRPQAPKSQTRKPAPDAAGGRGVAWGGNDSQLDLFDRLARQTTTSCMPAGPPTRTSAPPPPCCAALWHLAYADNEWSDWARISNTAIRGRPRRRMVVKLTERRVAGSIAVDENLDIDGDCEIPGAMVVVMGLVSIKGCFKCGNLTVYGSLATVGAGSQYIAEKY
ncbi:hypothetical protein F4809DRAFT_643767 [Biscogniauxia mediterranea]|nr:hypothetical protein F4809DRAFT_643767 [Biscogniauxia mediterranea]